MFMGVILWVALRKAGGRAMAKLGYALRPETTWRRLLMELSSDAMFMVDRSGRVLEANQSVCDLGGWTQAELLKQPVFIVLCNSVGFTVIRRERL